MTDNKKVDELDVLNFALNLEYLEAEFYTYATTGKSITSFGIGIKGLADGTNPTTGGTTVGGKKVNFSEDEAFTRDIAAQIGADERAHVVLLRGALGSSAVAMPNIDLGALGFGFGNQNDFLRAARILEDIGVTAYSGAAGLLKTPDIITTAACLLGAEAEHAASIRTQIARLKIPTTALDAADLVPPPSGEARQVLSIKVSDGLITTRTAGQVLYLAFGGKAGAKQGGFFPGGLNGTIVSSTEQATAPRAAA
jgi:ferritin-like protein